MTNKKQPIAGLETAGGTSAAPDSTTKAATKAAKAPRIPRASKPAAPGASKPAAKSAVKVPKDPKPEGAGTKVPKKRAAKPPAETVAMEADPYDFHEAPTVTYEMIAVRAYFLAENRQATGRPGDHDADWLEAERQLKAESIAISSSLKKAR